ncbi:MAG: hypothetical protein IKB02_05430 [Clostridia bacterium]|nr:hypothetical protein [Clostridia bacterium]
MFKVNDDLSIYVTRGDMVFLKVTAENNGEAYTFDAGEVLRIKVYRKKDCKEVVLQKDFPVTTATQEVELILEEADTKIGEVISKPVDYWYEVELNPFDNPQTIIGYDDDGTKVFKLFPEGDDIEDYEPITPEDIPIVDTELDMTSNRPVENQVIARAFAQLQEGYQATHEAVAKLHVTPEMFGAVGDGEADDTKALEKAVATLRDNSTLFLRGSYVVTKMHVNNVRGLTVTGGGSIIANNSCDFNFVKFNSCDNLTVHNIKIDGKNKPCRAFNICDTRTFYLTMLTVENVGNDTADASLYGIFCRNSHNGVINNSFVKYVHAKSVATGIALDGETDEEVPKNIVIDRVRIEDISPIDDADGLKILGAETPVNLTVSNSVFVDCAKRAMKFQAKGCYSHNNVIHVNKCNYASIDFQQGYGKSIDDTIHYNVTEIGIDGNGYIGVAVTSQVEVRGLCVTVANNDASLYSGATSSCMFLVQNLQGEAEIADVTIKDCNIDGCSMLVRNTLSIPVKRITVDNVTIGKLYQHAIFTGGEYSHICLKNCSLLNRPLGWNGILNGVSYDTCDIDITNIAAADTNAIGRPTNSNSRIVARGATSDFVSGSFVFENGKMIFITPTNVNPQGSIYSSGKNFAMAKCGDICYMQTPETDTNGFCVGYICTNAPDSTNTRGEWKKIYM